MCDITSLMFIAAQDCYMIGRQVYLKDDWIHARDWMLEALNKFDQGQQTTCTCMCTFVHST